MFLRVILILSVYLFKLVYCRPIEIKKNCENMIYDEDVIQLTGKTIFQHIYYFIENECSICHLHDGSRRLPCGCVICKKCFIKELKLLTNDKIILNSFEKCIFK